MADNKETERPKLALVIGAGSVKCAAAVGLCKVFQREGIEVDMAVGCSGGSLYATGIALGYDARAIEEMTFNLWKKEVMTGRDRRSLLQALLPRLFGFNEHFGLMDDRPLMALLEKVLGDTTFEQTRIPLYLMTTDLKTGEKVTLHQGRILDAIRASIAAPIIFRPWQVEGRLLIDGAMANPLPVDVAIKERAEIIVAMGFESPYHTEIGSLSTLAGQVVGIANNNLLEANYAFYNLVHHAEIIPIIPRFDRQINFADTHLIPYIIEEGERATEHQLPYLRRLLNVE